MSIERDYVRRRRRKHYFAGRIAHLVGYLPTPALVVRACIIISSAEPLVVVQKALGAVALAGKAMLSRERDSGRFLLASEKTHSPSLQLGGIFSWIQ